MKYLLVISILYIGASTFVQAQDNGVILVEINNVDDDGETDLTRSIKNNDRQLFEVTVNYGADLNAPNGAGKRPLAVALEANNMTMFNELISKGASAGLLDQAGKTLIETAIETGHKDVIGDLILKGANVNKNTPIVGAVEKNDLDLVRILADGGADLQPAVDIAASNGNTTVFRFLIEKEVRLKGTDAFAIALKNGNKEIARMAIDGGYSVKDALEQSLSAKNLDFIKICLEKGGKADDVIDYAVQLNDLDFFDDLLKNHKANANEALKVAGESGKINLIEIALVNGGNADILIEKAVKDGDRRLTEMLLSYKADATKALQIAVEEKNLSLAELAIKNGASVKKDNLISTAVDDQNMGMVRLLIQNGAKASVKGVVDRSVNDKNYELTKLLVENGADANEGIEKAVKSGMDEFSILLLNNGADGGKKGLVATASKEGKDQLVDAMIKHGGSPSDGLPEAVKNNHVSTARLLIQAGAVIHDPEYLAQTLDKNQDELTTLLLEKGAPTSYVSKKGETLLHIACSEENTDAVRILIQKGLQVNQVDSDGDTPLHAAVRGGGDNLDIVKLLLDHGADINAKNKKEQTPLKRAKGKKVVKFLEAKGAIE